MSDKSVTGLCGASLVRADAAVVEALTGDPDSGAALWDGGPRMAYPLLLVGSSGRGKRSWCLRTARREFGESVIRFEAPLYVGHIHTLRERMSVVPDSRVGVVLDLTDASIQVQSMLLKILEESNPNFFFLLHCDTDHLISPLIGRCQMMPVTLLGDSDVYEICRDAGMTDDEAHICTLIGRGRPGAALHALGTLRARVTILSALEAVRDDDAKALDAVCVKATQKDIDLLRVAVIEFVTGQWRLWSESELQPLIPMMGLVQDILRGDVRVPSTAFTAIMYAALHTRHGRLS